MKRFTPLLTLTALAVGACTDVPASPPGHDLAPVALAVSTPVHGGAGRSFPATVTAGRRAQVATRASGTVERVLVEVGDGVRAGDLLVTLDATDVGARVAAATARRDLAAQTHGRMERLAAAGAAAAAELDVATADLRAAEAALADARAQARYTELRAPFTGVVVARTVEPGDLAVPGRGLLELVGPGARTLEMDLPADLMGQVGVGDTALAVLPGTPGVVTVRVDRVADALEPGTRTFRVEADLPGTSGTAPPGGWARVTFPGGDGEDGGTRWIPADAVVRSGQLRGVYTVEADTVRLRWVRLGRQDGARVELLAGPTAPVVRRPSPTLRDGTPVDAVRVEPFGPAAEES